ncbi:hypothetical protein AB1N83_010616 [Pleurotus pulmonarius]|nr:hypothetical protein EYR38_003104 [Pleurotus pulmonarius]
MPSDKLHPEILLSVASFLPQSDALALSRTCRKMFSIIEIPLYANAELETGHSTAKLKVDPLDSFYAHLMAKPERCNYVQSLSICFGRALTSRDLTLVHATLRALPYLRHMYLTQPLVDFSGDDAQPIALHHAILNKVSRAFRAVLPSRRLGKSTPPSFSCITNRLPKRQSPRLDLTWSNQALFDTSLFLSFASLHSNIRTLYLPRCHRKSFPTVGPSVLPNLESIDAALVVVLALLPGRNIQRVKTHISGPRNQWEDVLGDTTGREFDEDGLRSIKVFKCHRDKFVDGDFLACLLRKMTNLEVLDLDDERTITPTLQEVDILSLQNTNLQLLRLPGRFVGKGATGLFQSNRTLECVDWSFGAIARLHRDGKRDQNVVWKCEPQDVWLADWKTDSLAS